MSDEPSVRGHYKIVITHPNGEESAIWVPELRID